MLEGKILNIKKIEQGLTQINRLQSEDIIMEIVASKKEGYSIILIKDNPYKRKKSFLNSTQIKLELDNSGSKSTGVQKKKLIISQDNLLGINDNIYFNYTKDNEDESRIKFSESLYGSIDIPYGKWNITPSYSTSKYLTTIFSTNNAIKSNGNTENKEVKIKRNIHKDKIHTIDISSSLTLKNTESSIQGSSVGVSSRKLSIASLSSSYSINSKLGYFYFEPSYIRGLSAFNAKKDEAGADSLTPKAQFNKFTFRKLLQRIQSI